MNAYDEGRDAVDNGPQESPYVTGTPEWEMWCDGWDSRSDEKLVEDQAALDKAMAEEDKYRRENSPGGFSNG
ncbi:MAG: hypothetical protein ACW99U_21635 [Candidatus Thorarchaeota archaeon]|jgi:hypothetical protein